MYYTIEWPIHGTATGIRFSDAGSSSLKPEPKCLINISSICASSLSSEQHYMNIQSALFTFFFLSLSCQTAAVAPTSNPISSTVALVYSGPALVKESLQDLLTLLKKTKKFTSILLVDHSNLTQTLSHFPNAVYVQGAGTDDSDSAFASFTPNQVSALRTWVGSGGRYLGICMGAYLAEQSYFNLLNGSVESQLVSSKDMLLPITFKERVVQMYVQSPPKLPDLGTVMARYNDSSAAMLVADFINGKVGAVGPHYEADDSWGVAGVDEKGSLEMATDHLTLLMN